MFTHTHTHTPLNNAMFCCHHLSWLLLSLFHKPTSSTGHISIHQWKDAIWPTCTGNLISVWACVCVCVSDWFRDWPCSLPSAFIIAPCWYSPVAKRFTHIPKRLAGCLCVYVYYKGMVGRRTAKIPKTQMHKHSTRHTNGFLAWPQTSSKHVNKLHRISATN